MSLADPHFTQIPLHAEALLKRMRMLEFAGGSAMEFNLSPAAGRKPL